MPSLTDPQQPPAPTALQAWECLGPGFREHLYRVFYGFCVEQPERPALRKLALSGPFTTFKSRAQLLLGCVLPGAQDLAVIPAGGVARFVGVILLHMGFAVEDIGAVFELLLDAALCACEEAAIDKEEREGLSEPIYEDAVRLRQAWAAAAARAVEGVADGWKRCRAPLSFLLGSGGGTTVCTPLQDITDEATLAGCQWLAESLFPAAVPPTHPAAQQLCSLDLRIAHCCELPPSMRRPAASPSSSGAPQAPSQSQLALPWRHRFTALRHRFLYFYDVDASNLITIDEPSSIIDLHQARVVERGEIEQRAPSSSSSSSSTPAPRATNPDGTPAAQKEPQTQTIFTIAIVTTSGAVHRLYFPSSIVCDTWHEEISKAKAFFSPNPYFDGPAAAFDPARDVDFVAAFRNQFPIRAPLSHFEFGALLGAGNFGRVIKCRHRPSGTVFALKIICKDVFKGMKNVVEVRREKELLEASNHCYIMHLHRTYQTRDRVYLLLDYLPGGELLRHTQKAPGRHFNEAYSRFYLAELACALEYLRRNDVLHRDIKGDNLVLDASGHLVLTDFGFAKKQQAGRRNKTCCGTLAYTAPEMLQNEGYSFEADWWSMGVVLFTMLTGFFPFLRPKKSDTIEAITKQPLQFPQQPAVPPLAADLCQRLLDKNPARRFSTLAQLKQHAWFEGFDWAGCESRATPSPYQLAYAGSRSASEKPATPAPQDEAALALELKEAAAVGYEVSADMTRDRNIFGSFYALQERAGSNRDEGSDGDGGDIGGWGDEDLFADDADAAIDGAHATPSGFLRPFFSMGSSMSTGA